MAKLSARNRNSAPGDWYVDTLCIDCGASRNVAPGLVVRRDELSVFARQPGNPEEELAAWRAALVCPTASIGREPRAKPPGLFPQELAPGSSAAATTRALRSGRIVLHSHDAAICSSTRRVLHTRSDEIRGNGRPRRHPSYASRRCRRCPPVTRSISGHAPGCTRTTVTPRRSRRRSCRASIRCRPRPAAGDSSSRAHTGQRRVSARRAISLHRRFARLESRTRGSPGVS